MSVLLFAGAAEALAVRSVELNITMPTSIAELIRAIEIQYPKLAAFTHRSRFAVNNQFVAATFVIKSVNMEIAMIPPVSGG